MACIEVTVVSTYATDRIYDTAGSWLSNQEGGPCLFIVNALQRLNVPYRILAPTERALVDIKLEGADEVGTIAFAPRFEVDWVSISTPFILISTVFDEVSLLGMGAYRGKVCLDAQGFVRKARSDGKKIWDIPDELYSNCFCLKVTEKELKYIPSDFVEKQKQKILLVTRGSRGVENWEKGEHKEVLPKEIIACPNTIGAGDTFFANFVAELSGNKSVDAAIENSLCVTTAFLKDKLNHIQRSQKVL